MATLLVTDGEERAALAVVRSVGGRGHRVVVASSRTRPLAGASRWCHATVVTPPPLDDPEGYAAAVEAAVERYRVRTVLPITEAAWMALFPLRERGVDMPGPSAEAFALVTDKRRLLEVASRLGMAVPRQAVLERPPDPGWEPPDRVRLPVYVKPSRSVSTGPGRRHKFGVGFAADAEALSSVVASYPREAYPLLLQEEVVGHGAGVFLLMWDGLPVASFAHRRIREKPPGGGVSVYRESAEPDPGLLASSVRLLDAFDWRGVAMVEYRVEASSGTPYLMEVNGRFWGSLQLAIDAGVDFPALFLALGEGLRPTPVTRYRTGVRSRWTLGDVDHFYVRLRDGAGVRDAARAAREFLAASGPSTRNEIFRLGDPRPFFREAAQWLRRS